MIKKIITVGAIILLSACAEMQQTAEPQPVAKKPIVTKNVAADKASAAIATAEKSRKAAAKVGYEWRDTAKIIKKAKAAVKKKNYKKAIKLANTAKKQGDDAVAQYKIQKNAGLMN